MSDVSLKTFPENYCEALALLYVQNQELGQKTPEEVCEMYWEAYFRIRRHTPKAQNSAQLKK